MHRNKPMKTNRRLARELCMQALYQYDIAGRTTDELLKFDWVDFQLKAEVQSFAEEIIKGTILNLETIDSHIKNISKNWMLDRMSHIDKAIIRFSIYSLLFTDIPRKVIIDEAVEIAKKYGDEKSFKFVNGILDAVKIPDRQ